MKISKLKYEHILFMLILSLVCNVSKAQDTSKKNDSIAFHFVNKSYGDSIVLRWIPTNGSIWQTAQNTGYTLKRIMIIDSVRGIEKTLIKELKPLSHEDILSRYTEKDKYVNAMDLTLYGEKFKYTKNIPTNLLDSIIQGGKQLETRYFIAMISASLSSEAGNVGALRYVDKDVIPGISYIYILSSKIDNTTEKTDSAVTYAINVLFPESLPTNIMGISNDKKIELQWSRKQLQNFDAYDIERSDDGGKSYNKINKTPFISPHNMEQLNAEEIDSTSLKINDLLALYNVYIDSIPENYKDYYYRIRGYDGFGSVGEYSEPVIAHGIDLTPPKTPEIDSVVCISSNSFKIYWKLNTTDNDFKGYFITRSVNIDGEYVAASDSIIGRENTVFTDKQPFVGLSNFYMVGAVDTAGNVSQSLPRAGVFKDSLPPISPTGLTAQIDSLGIVTLKWNKNSESDVKGYILYFSYDPKGTFTQVNQTVYEDNVYYDTISLKIINREVYYKIRALDYNSNQSNFSTIIEAKVPIMFSPTPAVAKRVYTNDNQIVSEWYASSSDRVIAYKVFRRSKNNGWELIDSVPVLAHLNFTYVDKKFDYNTDYDYSVAVVNEDGFQSKMAIPVGIVFNKHNLLKSITDFSVQLDQTDKKVIIKWEALADTASFIVIYKGTEDSNLIPYRSIEGNVTFFVDYKIETGKTYYYAIKIKQSLTDLESDLSEINKVQINK